MLRKKTKYEGTQNWHGLTGRPGRTAHVPIQQLKVDLSYQRDWENNLLLFRKVRVLAAEWDWEKCKNLMVMQRGRPGTFDGLYVIEGAGRRAALGLLGYKGVVPCNISPSDGRAHEARMKDALNTRVGQTPLDRFKSRCQGGDETCLALRRWLRDNGYILGQGYEPKNVSFIDTLVRGWGKNADLVQRALHLQVAINDGERLDGRVHKGFVVLMAEDVDIEAHALKMRSARQGLVNFITAQQSATAHNCARGILNWLNKNRRNKLKMRSET